MELFTRDWASTGCIVNQVPTLSCIWVVLYNLISALLALSAFIAIILIIYAGIKYITSQGDPQKVETARKTLTYTIIGLVVIVMSFGVLGLISTITGVSVDQLTQPPGLPKGR